MQTIKPEKIITTISNLKTGEVYKTEDEWKAKGVPEAEIRRDEREAEGGFSEVFEVG